MLQLRNSDYFRFNGIDSKTRNWMVCNVSDNTEFNLGFQREVRKDETNNGYLFKGVKDKGISFDITLIKIDNKGNPMIITDDDLFELNRWLYQNESKSLEIKDKRYKGFFTSCVGWSNGANNSLGYGYCTFQFECDGYMYSNDINYSLYVDGEKTFEATSRTNVNGELSKPIITFKLLEGTNLTIINLTNGETIELNGLNVGDTYIIYNKQRQMINSTNIKDYKVYANSNKKYLSYVYGVNRLKIKTDGRCKIIFKHEDKLGLQ